MSNTKALSVGPLNQLPLEQQNKLDLSLRRSLSFALTVRQLQPGGSHTVSSPFECRRVLKADSLSFVLPFFVFTCNLIHKITDITGTGKQFHLERGQEPLMHDSEGR